MRMKLFLSIWFVLLVLLFACRGGVLCVPAGWCTLDDDAGTPCEDPVRGCTGAVACPPRDPNPPPNLSCDTDQPN
jgi:hypothetical protein